MGCENRNRINLGQNMIPWWYFRYRDNKHLHLNKAANFFACLNPAGYLRRTDLMRYVNTWKFM
jgi:hypothetical protein